MPPSSTTDTASPSRCYTIRRLHGVTSQKNVSSILTVVRHTLQISRRHLFFYAFHFISSLNWTQARHSFWRIIIIIIIIIFLHGLDRLTCSGIDALPSFPGASTISPSSRFVVEGVFRESGVVHSFKVVDPVLFVFESHVLYSRDL